MVGIVNRKRDRQRYRDWPWRERTAERGRCDPPDSLLGMMINRGGEDRIG